MGLIVNFSDFENISATGLSPTDYVIGYRPGPNREIRSTIEEFFIYLQTLSSNNVYVAVSPNSANWNSTYSTVRSLSDTWEESVYITPLQVASASWDSVYSNVNSNSANYILDGGNTKGANISIGTNDAYNLSFETNAIPRLLITSDTLSGNTSKTSFGAGFATGNYSLAEGRSTLASGSASHAEGQDNNASGESSHAEGFDNATGRRNDFLTYTAATRTFTFANTVSAHFSYVSNGTVLRGSENSTLSGFFNITIASRDTGTGAISATADAIGADSVSGYLIDNKGSWAHAEGYGNTASGEDSHAEGYNNTASGDDSHAEGFDNTSSGLRSHAEGVSNKASGEGSHAQGSNTIASGDYSHTQGASTLASASRSTATGQFTSATKVTSYASGRLALADHSRSWVWQGTSQEGVSAIFVSTRTDQFAIRPTNGFFLSGAMGIGTDSIANALTVVGTISTIGGNSNQWNSTYSTVNSNSSRYTTLDYLSTNNVLLSALTVAENVGIGTDAPDQKLHVLKASAGTVTADTNSIAVFEGGGSNHISILTPNGNTGGVVFGSPSDNYGSYLSWNYDNNELKLGTDKTGGFISLLTDDEAPAVRITSTGNVGIGTIVPAQKLTVSGNVSALSAVYHIGNPPGTIPVFITIRNINALASTGTRTVGYNVPTGKRFSANSYSFVVTNTDQSSAFAVAPSIAITNGSTNKLSNDLTFSSGLTAPSYGIGNISSSGGSFGSGNTLRYTSTDTVGVSIVTPAYGGGTQTVFTGDVVIVGSLIDL